MQYESAAGRCLRQLGQALYPGACLLCAAPSPPGSGFCGRCAGGLPFNDSACEACAGAVAAGCSMCASCGARRGPVSRTVALFRYEFPVDAMILRLKRKGGMSLIPALSRPLCLAAAERLPRPDAVVAMPLHPARLRERGFNQSHEMARALCGLWGTPLDSGFCLRARDTPRQQGLSRAQRAGNIRGAFATRGERRYRRVLALDDVITTGSTMNELAAVMKRAGVGRVDALCLAKVAHD